MAEDRRAQWSKRAIREAYFGLLDEEDASSITVKEICAKADVNRSTFYRWYDGIEGLVAAISEEILEERFPQGIEILDDIGFLEMVEENQVFYRALFSTLGWSPALRSVAAKAFESCKEQAMVRYGTDGHAAQAQACYLFYGYLEAVHDWVEAGCPVPPAELAQALRQVSGGEGGQKRC